VWQDNDVIGAGAANVMSRNIVVIIITHKFDQLSTEPNNPMFGDEQDERVLSMQQMKRKCNLGNYAC
jgi:hypothetical protein